MIFPCPNVAIGDGVHLKGEVRFRNPYGYLPAQAAGFLPFFGLLAAAYIAALALYVLLAVIHRAKLTHLHFGTLAVIVFGVVEVVTSFLFYLQLDITGEVACCPVRPLAVLSIVLNAIKRSTSRVLLLSICLGYGVMYDKLSVLTTSVMGAVAVLYAGFAINKDIDVAENSMPAVVSLWNIPVLALDCVFLTWTVFALSRSVQLLGNRRQDAKLVRVSVCAVQQPVFICSSAPLYYTSITHHPNSHVALSTFGHHRKCINDSHAHSFASLPCGLPSSALRSLSSKSSSSSHGVRLLFCCCLSASWCLISAAAPRVLSLAPVLSVARLPSPLDTMCAPSWCA